MIQRGRWLWGWEELEKNNGQVYEGKLRLEPKGRVINIKSEFDNFSI